LSHIPNPTNSPKTVFLFTTALFLSGYVLQQQTVRDLRAAIQPQLVRDPPKAIPDLYLPPQFRDEEEWERSQKGIVDAVIEKAKQEDSMSDSEGGGEGEDETPEAGDDMVGATRWQKAARRKKLEAEAQAKEAEQKPFVSGGGEQKGDESVVEETKPKAEEEQISPAERRRRIKAQIIAEGEGEGFKGYRRRVG
jgi:hypothetical protein